MAERKATNKYYPPDWNPSKGSINKYRNSHPLRERARKLDQGILVIRFELPYNIWCDGCNNHVGMGVRYNAEKSKVGMYYTTPVYKFRMKCHLCDNHFEMQTDPANLDYIILNGARRQERRWDPEDNEQIDVDKSVSKKLSLDPMFKLEHDVIDKKKTVEHKASFDKLEEFQERWKDDYATNHKLRFKFRTNKKDLKEKAINDLNLLQKSSLPIELNLSNETSSDSQLAKLMKLQSKDTMESKSFSRRKQILSQSIFSQNRKGSLLISDKTSKKDDKQLLLDAAKCIKIKPSTSKSTIASCSVSIVPNYDDSSGTD